MTSHAAQVPAPTAAASPPSAVRRPAPPSLSPPPLSSSRPRTRTHNTRSTRNLLSSLLSPRTSYLFVYVYVYVCFG